MRETCMILVLLLVTTTTAFAGEVGIFLRDIPGCTVITPDGSSRCKQNGLLYNGDMIATKQPAASLDIQWIARDAIKLEQQPNGQYRVTVTPPPEKKGMLALAAELVGFARKAGRVTHGAVTRGGPEALPNLPGDGATLLSGEQVTFSWCNGDATQLVITSEQGRQTTAIDIPAGATSLTVAVNDLGMQPGAIYHWKPAGIKGKGGNVRILNAEQTALITVVLRQLDNAKKSSTETALQKAALLSYLSSAYAPAYSLGWLQYRILQTLPGNLSKDDAAAAVRLKAESNLTSCY